MRRRSRPCGDDAGPPSAISAAHPEWARSPSAACRRCGITRFPRSQRGGLLCLRDPSARPLPAPILTTTAEPAAAAAAEGARFAPGQVRAVTFALVLVTALASLESTVVSTAMPTIIGELRGLPVYS